MAKASYSQVLRTISMRTTFFKKLIYLTSFILVLSLADEGWSYASRPHPVDDAIYRDTWVSLEWVPGINAVSNDIYFGENYDDVKDGTGDTFQSNQSLTFYIVGFPGFPYPDGLVPGATYYWRIDDINDLHPDSPWIGDVWSFIVSPRLAYDPEPADGAEFIDPDVTLSWKPGYDAILHTVYFSDNFAEVYNASGGRTQGTTTYTPGSLELGKTYYWRIDEYDGVRTHKGYVWSFTVGASVSPETEGRIIYVDDDANAANDGSSWTDAYTFLQEALADARSVEKPVEIRVAQGIYKPDQGVIQTPGNRTATFKLINGVSLKGGYGGYSEPDPDARYIDLYKSILSGDLIGDDGADFVNNGENSYHVLTGSGCDETAVLNGFTIIGGNADDRHGDNSVGGGMYGTDGNPTITNCTFSYNEAHRGGAICCGNSSSIISYCKFSGNRAYYGGGVYTAPEGTPTIINCTFNGNHASRRGGGIFNQFFSSPTLTNCKIVGNTAGEEGSSDGEGGGVFNRDGCNPILINCIITDNLVIARSYGGGGGGICTWNSKIDSSQIFINCTFARNSAPRGNSLSYDSREQDFPSTVQLTNCILWDSGNKIWNIDGSTIRITYSDVQGGWSGQGNININPLFVDADGADNIFGTEDDDLRLLPDSLCVDAGDNSAIPQSIVTDLDGYPRIVNDTVDMGAYEFKLPPISELYYVGQVTASEDDGYAFKDIFQNLDMDFLRVGSSSFAKPPYYVSGMVFRNVEIPRGAIIISARLKICAYTDQLTDITFGKIEAESADNAASFGISRHIDSLPRTSVSINWDIIEPWSPDTWYESPDIAEVIQELIDRDGWSSNNSLAIIYSSRSEGGYRNFSSYDRDSDYAPKLEITFIP